MVEKKRIVGYVRVSTTKQRDEGVSLDAQRHKIKMYAEMYDLELTAIEIDVASGKDMSKRPALKRSLEMLKNNEADGLLIMKLDRLTRRVKDICFMVEEYFQDKILISVSDQIDTQTPTGILMLNILTTFAQWERQVLSQRTCEAMGFLKESGVKLGRLPFGFRYSGEEDEDGRKEIMEDREETITINRMIGLRRDNLSLQAIADILQADGHTTQRGGPWQPWTVGKIIKRTEERRRLESEQRKVEKDCWLADSIG